MNSVPCVGTLIVYEWPKCLYYGLILVLKVLFFFRNWLDFFRRDLNLTLLTCVGLFEYVINDFVPCSGSECARNARKCIWSWHTSIFKIIFLQIYLVQFSVRVTKYSFLLEKDYFCFRFRKLVSYIGVGIRIGQKGKAL